jgi:ABC-type phosphate transport system substrate-binding protein
MRKSEMKAEKISRWLLGSFIVVLFGLGAQMAAANTLIIANENVRAEEIDKRELQKMFLGRSSEFGGQRVVLATLRGGSSHKNFMASYLQMTPHQFTNHWRKIVFSGTGKEPTSFESEAELVAFISKTPGAIGYISSSTAHSGVKALSVN